MTDTLLFDDLKVIDCGSWIAGPVAATILADFGADVIKIETPETGDGYRMFSPSLGAPDSTINFCWQMDARNKRSLALNLKSEGGREVLRALIREADVFVTNFNDEQRDEWGLQYADLHALNPRLIYASLTPYGENGDERDKEAFDLVAYWGRSGLMDLVRATGADPAPACPGMGDHPTAVAMYAAITTALLRRAQTGEGSYVHTSLLANGIWSASCIAQAVFVDDAEFTAYRQRVGQAFTRSLYATRDHRWLQLTMVRTPEEMDRLFTVLGVPELLVDERFSDPELRFANGSALIELLKPVVATRDASDWLREFEAARVPVSLVGEVEDLAQDKQVALNDILLPGADTGMSQVVKHPVNVDGLARAAVRRAPEIGEHNDEILRELGYDDAAIAALKTSGVV